jgi:tetratricopeptide (TPR) repeat protein
MPAEDPKGTASETPIPAAETTAEPQPSRLRRLVGWAAGNRLKAGLVVGASAVSIAGMVVLLAVLLHEEEEALPPPVTLDMALEALDRGEYDEARQMARLLRQEASLPPNELGGPAFVLGAAAVAEARQAKAQDANRCYLVAAGYLEDARNRGFPQGRKGEGLLLLGESLYQSGQVPASRPAFLAALAANPGKQSEIHSRLASAYMEDATPKLSEALKHNDLYLSDRLLSQAQRRQGLLQKAEILFRMGKLTECRQTLDQVQAQVKDLAGALVLRGQILMQQARDMGGACGASAEAKAKARERYEEAAKTLRQAQSQDTLGTQVTRRAQYLIGVCFLETGDYRAAAAQFERTELAHGGTPEALAAGFQQAELARRLGRDGDTLAAYRRVLRSVGDPKNYSNPWISLDELRNKVLEAYRHYADRGNYGVALQLAQAFHPLLPLAKKTQWVAETYEQWGRTLLAKAGQLPVGETEPLCRQARTHLRQAGRAYQELAKLETTTRQYPDYLWSGAECYLGGHDFQDAVVVLKEYLKSEPRRRRSLALVNQGEALLALNRVDDALATLRDCVDFHPRDSAAYRARLLASRAYAEKGDSAKAEDLLEENLNGVLSPSSQEWEQSLFDLGRLHHASGQYERAVVRLGEAIKRYPKSSQTLEARYLIADSHRRRAAASQEQMGASQAGNVRQNRGKQVQESLTKALQEYEQIQQTLGQRQQVGTLTSEEKAILRNSCFAAGDVLFDLGRYQEAAQTYTTAAYRYQSDPTSLSAYLQIAAAYQRMDQLADARNTLKQAKVVLSRIKDGAAFDKTTPYSRKQWETVLDQRLAEL